MTPPLTHFVHPPQWVTTRDGSVTLLGPQDEPYHSLNGALTESQHVYYQEGLCYWRDQHPHATTCHILEIGYGTGLNASVACNPTNQDLSLHYTGLDPYPPDPPTLSPLIDSLPSPIAHRLGQLNALSWGVPHHLSPTLTFEKQAVSFHEWTPPTPIDVLFFDAFSPTVAPHMWQQARLALVASWLRPGGVLVTYCAKGTVRRGLIEEGFTVTRLPGPPGKHHMLRGIR